jgi:hypothetical protein
MSECDDVLSIQSHQSSPGLAGPGVYRVHVTTLHTPGLTVPRDAVKPALCGENTITNIQVTQVALPYPTTPIW